MSTIKDYHFPRQLLHGSWPLKFFERRERFNREAQNQPYIEWLRRETEVLKIDSDCGESTDEWSDDEDAHPGGKERQDEIDDAEERCKPEMERDREEANDHRSEDNEEHHQEPCNVMPHTVVSGLGRRSIARVFMEGLTGNRECLPYRDQVDAVAGLCDQLDHKVSSQEEKLVAILDDLGHGSENATVHTHHRLHRGPLTRTQLKHQMTRQRFKTITNASATSAQTQQADIDRRILFMLDLDPSALEVVFETAPRSHALALKNFFHGYLTSNASMGVSITPRGFQFFTFSLHIPFYVLEWSLGLSKDTRTSTDGKPLRRSWYLPVISGSQNMLHAQARKACLYETQLSMTIIGIDHRFWTTYGAFDSWYTSEESNHSSHDGNTRRHLIADRLTVGHLFGKRAPLTPREYLFSVCQTWMFQVRREWRVLVDTIEEEVERYDRNAELPLNFDDKDTLAAVRASGNWNGEMIKLLRRLISRLRNTVDAWERFARKDIGYFLFDDEVPTESRVLKSSVNEVDNVFLELTGILKKLEQLERGRCQDSPQGLHAHLSHWNHEAQLFQQKSARNIQILTVIAIAHLPIALAASIFGVGPGVLPFVPNFGRFVLCVLVLVFLIVASVAALFKWDAVIQLIPGILSLRNASQKRYWPDLETGVKNE